MGNDQEKGFRVTDRRVSAEAEDQSTPAKDQKPHASAPQPHAEPLAIDFSTFLLSLSTSALMYLGYGREENSKEAANLTLAKQTIDCIALLEEKTSGNLSGEEERLMSEILYDLRMRYVNASKPNH